MKINERNLCIFATSKPYDAEGFLNKRGEVNKAFQRRYFVLKGNLLFYFERKGDREPLGLIIVEGCTIGGTCLMIVDPEICSLLEKELSEESGEQYCFEIAFNGNRTYILSAESQESMETWMKVLTCAGYEYKKLMVAELQRQLEEIEGARNKMLGLESSSAAATAGDGSAGILSVPRPPPRRQNPFNRPAPPLPAPLPNVHNGQGQAPLVPFINGHFGSSSQRANYSSSSTDNATVCGSGVAPHESSPKPPPRSAGKSEFYSQLPQQQQNLIEQQQEQQQPTSAKPIVFAAAVASSPSSAASSANDLLRSHHQKQHQLQQQDLPDHSSVHFEQLHERFRQLVMKDVRAYREQRELRSQPLIHL